MSDKEEEKFEGILENSIDGSLVGDVERDDLGNEYEDF